METQTDKRETQTDKREAQTDNRKTQTDEKGTQTDKKETQTDKRDTQPDNRETQTDKRETQTDNKPVVEPEVCDSHASVIFLGVFLHLLLEDVSRRAFNPSYHQPCTLLASKHSI